MITVRVPKQTLWGFGSDIHAMLHSLDALRKAGVPVQGALGVMGVDNGTLTMYDDGHEMEWTWRPGEVEDLS